MDMFKPPIFREIKNEAIERVERSISALNVIEGARTDKTFRDAVDHLQANFMLEVSAPSRNGDNDLSPEYIIGFLHALDFFAHPNYHLNRLENEKRKIKANYEQF